jgi:hypothetical protein
MNKLNIKIVTQYVEDNISTFHEKRVENLKSLRLRKVLRRKNPYLFKAKYLLTAEQIVKSLSDAFISSNEETIFGDWLEGLAIFINSEVYKGWKSGIPGIDLEFNNKGIRNIIAIKSGPNWGNSGQIKKMRTDFVSAMKTLRTGNSKLQIKAVNGCCYGKDNKSDKGDYYKLCGQEFWRYISGCDDLYLQLIEPLGQKAKERNDDFIQSYSQMINRFSKEFLADFCLQNGEIDWVKLVEFNSGQK